MKNQISHKLNHKNVLIQLWSWEKVYIFTVYFWHVLYTSKITIIFFQQKVNNSIFQHPNKSEWAILQSILGCYKFFYWVDLPEAFNVQCFCLKYKFTAIKLQYAKSLSLYTWFKSLNIIRDPHVSRIIIKGQKTYWLQ